MVLFLALPVAAADPKEDLWTAARKGDAVAVRALLEKGVDVNTKTHYGATALWFAAYKGHLDIARVLLEHRADVNAADSVWELTPLQLAAGEGRDELVRVLLEAGAEGVDKVLLETAGRGNVQVVRALLEKGKVTDNALAAALLLTPASKSEITELLKKAGARTLAKMRSPAEAEALKIYEGTYETLTGRRYQVTLKEGILIAKSEYGDPFVLQPTAKDAFQAVARDSLTITFERQGEKVNRLLVKRGSTELASYDRTEARKEFPIQRRPIEEPLGTVTAPGNWPSFRGPHASGAADGQQPPVSWDGEKGTNIVWKMPIPGLAHSAPIVWGEQVFVTTAVSSDQQVEFKPGLYGAGTEAKDITKHSWKIYCLDKQTGKVIWEQTARESVPLVKRHIKSSHANATPVTDGKHLIASFASEGLYCYDLAGKLQWKQELGVLDNGAFNDPDLQWGAASSPILYRNLVIVQCDRQKDSYLAAFNVADGQPVWRTARDEHPSWGTPTIVEGPARVELVTNATKYVRGYDPLTGKDLWRLARNAEITVPTPIAGQGLIYVTSGYRPIQPIYAIRPGATGDISLPEGKSSSEFITWSTQRGGPYLPTPILYGDYFYTLANAGMVVCYEAKTGKQVYKERLSSADGYTASPVAADGKLYFLSEEGKCHVIKAGPHFERLAMNPMGEYCMATPAIADGMMFIRAQHHLFGIGRERAARTSKQE
jgi:outer membrane protein assembly factor BamB